MEPTITGSTRLSRVQLSSQALLKIVQHGTKALPELCAGALLGLDDDNEGLEVSDCFAFPGGSSSKVNVNTTEEELLEVSDCFAFPGGNSSKVNVNTTEEEDDDAGNTTEADVAEFKQDMMRLLKDCNMEDFCVGWYRTVNMGDWCNSALVEQQFEQQDECDQSTGKAKSVLIIYDPYQTDKGSLSIKALRLTDAFMDIMRTRTNPDPRIAVLSDAALSRFHMDDIFYEIPIEFNSPSILITTALTELKIGGTFSSLVDLSEIGLDRLVLATDPYLEKNIAFTIEELEALHIQKEKANQHQKNVQKQKIAQDKWVGQRQAENAARMERGEEPLPLRDQNQSVFRPLKDSSKLESLLIRKQIDSYCEQINSWTSTSFEKLFLVSAIQQQGGVVAALSTKE